MTVPYFALLLSFVLITLIQAVLLIQMIWDFNKPEETTQVSEEVAD